MVFHYLIFHWYAGSSIIYDPLKFWAFYLPKIGICFFIAALSLMFEKKGWTIVTSVIIAVWIWAEVIYYRVNNALLDAYSITMIGNMKGFWDSVLAFIRPVDIVIALPSFGLALAFFLLKPRGKSVKTAVAAIVLSVVLHMGGTVLIDIHKNRDAFQNSKKNREVCFNPFSEEGAKRLRGSNISDYASRTSVIHCLILNVWELLKTPFQTETGMSPEELVFDPGLQLFNTSSSMGSVSKGNLYIILFESLENWSISPRTTPAIYDLIESHVNVLWARKVKSQTRGGTSGDGQMIVNAGVLPVSAGATCFRFPNNCYPSLSEIYEKAALIQPGDMSVWNQKRMSAAYHIMDNLVVPDKNDSTTFSILTDIYREYPYVMAISMASHAPFLRCPENMKLSRDSSMPKKMADYLDCVHYTDSLLGDFLKKVDTDETLRNSTIIITGDHTIFDDEHRQEFNDYFLSSGEEDKKAEAYCPFIIYSPSIKEKTIVEEEVYQMDIFPTALHAIGCDSTYYWKGFGINLLDRDAVRTLTEEKAFALSEKMIEADYWKYIKDGDAAR